MEKNPTNNGPAEGKSSDGDDGSESVQMEGGGLSKRADSIVAHLMAEAA
jgi:hypothetical protein